VAHVTAAPFANARCGIRSPRLAAAALRLLGIVLLYVGGALLSCAASAAQDNDPSAVERSVKAAYLYKFLAYVDWPPAAFPQQTAPIVIGVVGAYDIADELSRITASRSVHSRALSVRRMREGDPLDDVQLLFIGRAVAPRQEGLLKQAQQRPILTVTDAEAGREQGSIINFRTLDGRVRFDVSITAAERSELRLSSRLLSVAASVQGAAP
jgi:YfiR/HmsC-like